MLTKEEFKKLPIFISSMSRLDDDLSSASIALAKVLSRTNLVYYIEYPFTWLDLLRKRNYPKMLKRLPSLLFGKHCLIQVKGQSKNLSGSIPSPGLPIFSLPPVLYKGLELNIIIIASFHW